MNTIHVDTSKSYDILIGANLLDKVGMHTLSALKKPCKIAIISDDNVFPLYGNIVEESLSSAGFTVIHYVFSAGESSKNANTYLNILNFLAENQLSRSDALLALGGGVVGDMCGFAAATYLRGIPYIQVPTTLLAMVDSSVGGKTAIDLPTGKNLVGAFYQPSLVLCDLNALNSLPQSIFSDGCAEVIKYGVLYDKDLFSHLSQRGLNFDKKFVVSRCVALKRNVVMADEFDTGERQKLNLGHTIGHAIETLSNFTITHGQAVSIGMAIVSKAGCNTIYKELVNTLRKFNLPTTTDFTAKMLCNCTLSDKKRSGDTINLIVPIAIGACSIVPTHVDKLESFIKEGL